MLSYVLCVRCGGCFRNVSCEKLVVCLLGCVGKCVFGIGCDLVMRYVVMCGIMVCIVLLNGWWNIVFVLLIYIVMILLMFGCVLVCFRLVVGVMLVLVMFICMLCVLSDSSWLVSCVCMLWFY